MSFEQDIAKFRQKTTYRGGQAVRKVALELHKRVVEKTPHDTGRAKANNQLALNLKPTDIIEETDKTGRLTMAKAQAEVAKYIPGDTIWIANNVEYIIPLEFEGHSKQAPNGMFRVSIEDILNAWPRIVREAK